MGSEKCTQAEVKKMWSDIEVDVRRRMAVRHQSVAKTGGKTGEEGPNLFEQRICAIMGDSLRGGGSTCG